MQAVTWLHDEVINHPKLSLEEIGLYSLLCYLAKQAEPINVSRLMKLTGRTRPTINTYLAALQDAQLNYRVTKDSPDEKELQRRQANDLLKLGLALRKGISVVEVRAEHLTLKALERLIPPQMPRRNPQGFAAVLSFLEKESAAYRPSTTR